jgi:hypothetical protein
VQLSRKRDKLGNTSLGRAAAGGNGNELWQHLGHENLWLVHNERLTVRQPANDALVVVGLSVEQLPQSQGKDRFPFGKRE